MYFQGRVLGALHLGLPQRVQPWGQEGARSFTLSPHVSVKLSPAFVSLRAAESLPGFKSWRKSLLYPHPPTPLGVQWILCGAGRDTARGDARWKQNVLRGLPSFSQVHLEINPSPSWEGEIQHLENISCRSTPHNSLYFYYFLFFLIYFPPFSATQGWLLWQLKKCHEQQESGRDRVSAGMGEEECELGKHDGLLRTIKNCPIKRRVIQ